MIRFFVRGLIVVCCWPAIGHSEAADSRSHLIEMQLRDLARRPATAPTLVETPTPSDCGLCSQPARLPSADYANLQRAEQEQQHRDSLRRAQREILEQRAPHDAGHLIEETLRDERQSNVRRPATAPPPRLAISDRGDCVLCGQAAYVPTLDDGQPVPPDDSAGRPEQVPLLERPGQVPLVERPEQVPLAERPELSLGLHRLQRETPEPQTPD